jgi:Flp pilus assembly protein CpaB
VCHDATPPADVVHTLWMTPAVTAHGHLACGAMTVGLTTAGPTGWSRLLGTGIARRRRLRLLRRCLALLLGVVAVLLLVGQLRPTIPATVPMVVASRPLPAGHVLRASDLRAVEQLAAAAAPTTSARIEPLLGARLALPIGPGEPLTTTHLATTGLSAPHGQGLVAVPVRVHERATARLVSPGDRIDVLLVRPAPGSRDSPDLAQLAAEPVAEQAVVAVVPRQSAADTALLILAVPADTAARLASAEAEGRLVATLR